MNDELAVDETENQPSADQHSADSMQSDALLELLLQKIEAKSRTVADALRLAAIPFHFDSEILRTLRGSEDDLEEKIIERLTTFSFVEQRNDFFTLSREMRDLLLRQWQTRREEFAAANHRLIDYFRRRLESDERPPSSAGGETTSDKTATELKLAVRTKSSSSTAAADLFADDDGTALLQRDTLQLSILYHTLAVDGEAGLVLLEALMDEAEAGYRLATAEQLVMTAEAQRMLLSVGQQLYLDYQRARLDQLHGRWQVNRTRLEALLEEGESVPLDLQARIRRDLGRSLAEQGNYVAAVELQKRALTVFENQHNQREIGYTMNALGETHVGLALNAWGGGEPFSADSNLLKRWGQRFFEPGLILLRLPMLIYFSLRLGWRTVWRSIFTIGIDVDWVVARLFSEAVRWFERAQQRFTPGDPGLAEVEENLGELHLSLRNPAAAIHSWRALLATNATRMDDYRQARAQLGLANALMQCGNFDEASAILTQIESIFERYGHRRRLAQTQTLLAQCRLRQKETATAIEKYQSALRTWQQERNLIEATDVFHQLADVDAQAAEAAGRDLKTRHYPVRFQHPFLLLFQQGALIALVAVSLFILLAAVRTESGTRVNSTPTLIQPISPSVEDEFSPSVSISFSQQLQPEFNASIVWPRILQTLSGYLLLYTLVGLLFIRRMPLQSIQEGERSLLILDEEGITQAISGKPTLRLHWADIQTFITQDRFRFGELGVIFSATFLQGKDKHGDTQLIKIRGVASHYFALQQFIRQRLPKESLRYNTGFSLFRSFSGWLLLISVSVLILFLLLAQFDALKPWLTQPLLLGYGLSDLYPLTYLTIGVLLVWWFVAQPLRSHLILHPESPWIWAGFGIGIVLALLALNWLIPDVATVERPDVVLSILALMFVIPTTLHFWWTPSGSSPSLLSMPSERIAKPTAAKSSDMTATFAAQGKNEKTDKQYLYPAPVRYGVTLVAAILVLALLWFAGREWLSFNIAVRGNYYRTQAESARVQYRLADADSAYANALTAYERSLALRQDAAVVNSKGAILNRMKRYRLAVEAYQSASKLDPKAWVYRLNEGLAYEQWATEVVTPAKKLEYYLDAINIYSQLLDEPVAPTVTGSNRSATPSPVVFPLSIDKDHQDHKDEVRLFRAGATYALARQYSQGGDKNNAAISYQQSYADYDWLISNVETPQSVYYSGRGYTRMFVQPVDYPAAIADFQRAIELDKRNVAAFTGLTWSNFFQVRGYDSCRNAESRGIPTTTYIAHIQGAVDAISQAINLQQTSGIHYRTRAQLRYLLRECPGYDKADMYRQAIADYENALRYRPNEVGWWFTKSMLRVALTYASTEDGEKLSQLVSAKEEVSRVAKLEPSAALYWLGSAYIYVALHDLAENPNSNEQERAAQLADLINTARVRLESAEGVSGADAAIAAIHNKNDGNALARLFREIGDEVRAMRADQAARRYES